MRGVRAVCVIALAGCTASGAAVEPPPDALFAPTGIAVSPDDSVLFVANANSELRWNGGTVIAIDLNAVDQTIAAWTGANRTAATGCSPDSDHRETLVCEEAPYIEAQAGARIGNFATAIAVQDTGGGHARLIVPTRGDPSVEWIDWDGSALSCGTGTFAMCDDAHRLTDVHGDSTVGLLPTEPFGAYADSTGQFAIVTHLDANAVTLIDSPIGSAASIADVATGLFVPDQTTGLSGTSGVDGANGIVYVGSPYEDRIQTFSVGRPVNDAPPYLIPEAYFFLDGVGGSSGDSSNTRGLAFSLDKTKLYELNRNPPSVTVLQGQQSIAAVDVCLNAEQLAPVATQDGERVLVTCFQDGELDIIDPRGLGSLADAIQVGRGAYAVAVAPTRNEAFVTNFLEETISVIDIATDSPTHDRVVMKIGVPVAPDTTL